MAKSKTAFFCENCGAESSRWIGHCPSCNSWNTYLEEVIIKTGTIQNFKTSGEKVKPVLIKDIQKSTVERIKTNISEFDRILGGGIVPGSLILLGGEPGIGKSTIALQIALLVNNKTVYISGEESAQQIKLRADRIKSTNENCYILNETNLENILDHLYNIKPELAIIDSIQTLQTSDIESIPGNISQIRECANRLQQYAKEFSVPIILIGHITKDGNIAGPKLLEHVVDTVLLFEGENTHLYRLLRTAKNRFGSTYELGIFEMTNSGLLEIKDPSDILISKGSDNLSGVSITCSLDGIRPLLIEVQALVSTAAYGMPQRSTTGFDTRRLNMLLAVLEKRAGFRLASKDVFLNITGGLKINDPAIDLGVIASVLSSDIDKPVPKNKCFIGEVGLSGEIRPVSRIGQRIQEAKRLGFKDVIISKYNKKINEPGNINITCISMINGLIKLLF